MTRDERSPLALAMRDLAERARLDAFSEHLRSWIDAETVLLPGRLYGYLIGYGAGKMLQLGFTAEQVRDLVEKILAVDVRMSPGGDG